MTDRRRVERAFDRLRRGHRHAVVASLGGAKAAAEAGLIRSAKRRLSRAYGGISADEALRRYWQDKRLLRDVLTATARELGRESRTQMRRIRRYLWHDYLNQRSVHGKPGPRRAVTDVALRGFARSLAAYVVAGSDAPYPYLEEDQRILRARYDLPRQPSRRGGMAAGVVDEPALDAGVAVPSRPNLPQTWRPWGSTKNADLKYARLVLGARDDRELKLAALSRDKRPRGSQEAGYAGHPLVALAGVFWTPEQAYTSLRKGAASRNDDLVRLIKRLDRYLVSGQREYDKAFRENDWETLRPLLEAAKWSLFPNMRAEGSPSSVSNDDEVLHLMCDDIIDVLEGWTIRDWFTAITVVASLALSFVSMGALSAAAVSAIRVVAVLVDVGSVAADLVIADQENRQRAMINRFVAIDLALKVAARPESLTPSAALGIASLLLPAVGRGAVRSLRDTLLRRVLPKLKAGSERVVRGVKKAPTRLSGGPKHRAGQSAGDDSVSATSRGTTARSAGREASGEARALPGLRQDEVDRAIDAARSPRIVGGRKKPRFRGGPRVPASRRLQQFDIEQIPRRLGESQIDALLRVMRVYGHKVSAKPAVLKAWNAARARILKNAQLTPSNYEELYDRVRDAFWRRVRRDMDARRFFEEAGFEFVGGTSTTPRLAGVAGGVPRREINVSLDHIAEKAQGDNWRLALDGDNLEFMPAAPNSDREIRQMRHTALRQ